MCIRDRVYLEQCAGRLNKLALRFPNIRSFDVTKDDRQGTYYIHAIPYDRIKFWEQREHIALNTYHAITSAIPTERIALNAPEIVGKNHPRTDKHHPAIHIALAFHGRLELEATITALEKTLHRRQCKALAISR